LNLSHLLIRATPYASYLAGSGEPNPKRSLAYIKGRCHLGWTGTFLNKTVEDGEWDEQFSRELMCFCFYRSFKCSKPVSTFGTLVTHNVMMEEPMAEFVRDGESLSVSVLVLLNNDQTLFSVILSRHRNEVICNLKPCSRSESVDIHGRL